MSSSSSPTPAVPTTKKRARRENRRFADGNPLSSGYAKNEMIKLLTKTPTRTIPDILGFVSLSKTEIKKDTKEINRGYSFTVPYNCDNDNIMDEGVSRSLRPQCGSESTILKKRDRLTAWLRNPEKAEEEIQYWQHKTTLAREALSTFENDREKWLESFQLTRKTLSDMHRSVTKRTEVLQRESGQLLAMCEEEVSAHSKSRKKRVFHLKDAVEELADRDAAARRVCEALAKGATATTTSSGTKKSKQQQQQRVPTVTVSLSELDYPEDRAVFKKRRVGAPCVQAAAKKQPAAPSVASKVHLTTEAPQHKPVFSDPYLQSSLSRHSANESKESYTSVKQESVDDEATMAVEPTASVTRAVSGDSGTTEGATTVSDDTSSSRTAPASVTDASPVEPPPATDLVDILQSLSEGVLSSEASLHDLELFFAPDRDEENRAIAATVGGSSDTVSVKGRGSRGDQALKAFDALGGNQAMWSQFLEKIVEAGTAQGAHATRKKKKGAEVAIPLRASVRPHTQFGVSLLLSPLSQFEDRMLGTLSGETIFARQVDVNTKEVTFASSVTLPQALVQAEDDAMERCLLQSAAAAAELKIAQLRQANADLLKAAGDSAKALKRSEDVYRHAQLEDAFERRRIRKELVLCGIAAADPDDPPMSPIQQHAPIPPLFHSTKGQRSGLNGRRGVGSTRGFASTASLNSMVAAAAPSSSSRNNGVPRTVGVAKTVQGMPNFSSADEAPSVRTTRNGAVAAAAAATPSTTTSATSSPAGPVNSRHPTAASSIDTRRRGGASRSMPSIAEEIASQAPPAAATAVTVGDEVKTSRITRRR